jgi:hypothetical protein
MLVTHIYTCIYTYVHAYQNDRMNTCQCPPTSPTLAHLRPSVVSCPARCLQGNASCFPMHSGGDVADPSCPFQVAHMGYLYVQVAHRQYILSVAVTA